MDENRKNNAKVSGYLEKKGKMKMMNSFKRYWFVLEGRLLLYYRSKDEYEAISPCKGSINLGPPCNVKPCSSQSGIFQIETRTNTITLKAENQEDQNRWMLGIMFALKQNTSSTKLSHFRYSLDELPQQNTSDVSEFTNTMPQTMTAASRTSECQPDDDIIQRLQKIGGQSYGPNRNMMNLIVRNRNIDPIVGTNFTESSQYKLVDLKAFRDTEIKSGQQAAFKTQILSENTKPGEVILEHTDVRLEQNIYEIIDDELMVVKNGKEVSYSVPKKINYKGTLEDTENMSPPSGGHPDMIGKDQGNKITRTSFVLENKHYCSVNKKISFPNTDSEMIYVEPKCTDLIDHNENSFTALNRIHGIENAYSINAFYDTNQTLSSVAEYEDLDKYVDNTDLRQPNDELYSECTPHPKSKSKAKKEKKGKQYKNSTEHEKKPVNVKKSSSFIRRMWKRKSKRKERNIENLYEVIPNDVVEKVTVSNETAIQMLSELHNILENKKPVLHERLAEELMKINDKNQREHGSEITTDVSVGDADDYMIEQVADLREVIKPKNFLISEFITDDKFLPMEPIRSTISAEKTTENQMMIASAHSEVAPISSDSENDIPMVPIKQKARTSHDIPETNQEFFKRLLLKDTPYDHCESLKSIDEILNDLHGENNQDMTQNKVKRLIKQFSAPDFYENDVVLRNKRGHCKAVTDSDELSRLLDELAKVTCAPILTPGVTSSLISPNLTDDELIKLLPQRRRRYSEPDYDIPRPHKSLINLPRKEEPSDIVIESTRFFGPILKPAEDNINRCDVASSDDVRHLLSMTPDSLEPDVHEEKLANLQRSTDEDDKTSYTSHNYIMSKNYSDGGSRSAFFSKNKLPEFEYSMSRFNNIIIENDIYAQPKSCNIESRKESKFNDENRRILKKVNSVNIQIDEEELPDVSIDSLEDSNREQ